MDDNIVVPGNLASQFKTMDDIASALAQLTKDIGTVNTDNELAVGSPPDQVAVAYHKQVDDPTKSLSSLIQLLGQIFAVAGEKGVGVADLFERSVDTSSDVAGSL
jgi:hypothetical protein